MRRCRSKPSRGVLHFVRTEAQSGTQTKDSKESELLGLGDHEFVPWQIGIMS